MINSTLLEMKSLCKTKEFLTAQASQLDKLDFLMQAMIKTSRLETGVISLEKKSQPLYDTLAAALGGILLNAEKNRSMFKWTARRTWSFPMTEMDKRSTVQYFGQCSEIYAGGRSNPCFG